MRTQTALPIPWRRFWFSDMAETREYNPDGSLSRLIVDNRDKELILQLENLQRNIPNDVARMVLQEFDATDTLVNQISRSREQLLNMVDTYSFVFDFVYYPGGEIDTIRIRTFDASEPPVKLDDKTVKHYLDGTQPELI